MTCIAGLQFSCNSGVHIFQQLNCSGSVSDTFESNSCVKLATTTGGSLKYTCPTPAQSCPAMCAMYTGDPHLMRTQKLCNNQTVALPAQHCTNERENLVFAQGPTWSVVVSQKFPEFGSQAATSVYRVNITNRGYSVVFDSKNWPSSSPMFSISRPVNTDYSFSKRIRLVGSDAIVNIGRSVDFDFQIWTVNVCSAEIERGIALDGCAPEDQIQIPLQLPERNACANFSQPFKDNCNIDLRNVSVPPFDVYEELESAIVLHTSSDASSVVKFITEMQFEVYQETPEVSQQPTTQPTQGGGEFIPTVPVEAILILVIPFAIWFVALVIALGFGYCSKPMLGEFEDVDNGRFTCCGTPMQTVRRLSIATWCFSILVWVSTWAVLWSGMSYFLSFPAFVMAIVVQNEASAGPNFMKTSTVIPQANGYKIGFIILGVLLILNSIVAFVQLGLARAYFIGYYSSDSQELAVLNSLTGLGIVAGLSMIITAGCAMALGESLVQIANATALRNEKEKEEELRRKEPAVPLVVNQANSGGGELTMA